MTSLTLQQQILKNLYLQDKKTFEEANRNAKKLSDAVDSIHKLYIAGILLAKETRSKSTSRTKPEDMKFSFKLFEQDITINCNPTNVKGWKAFIMTQSIDVLKRYLCDIFCESVSLLEYIRPFNPFTLEKWIHMNFQEKPVKLDLKSSMSVHLNDYGVYFNDQLIKTFTELQPKINPEEKVSDLIKIYNEKHAKCQDKIFFIEDFNLERVEKKSQTKQFENFKFYHYLGLLDFEYSKPTESKPDLVIPVSDLQTDIRRDDFVTSLEKCFSNVVAYQNRIYYHNPRKIKQVLSSNLSNEEKEDAIISYNKQNL